MSRLKQRKDNNCLNCKAEVQGRFCHVCGQENIEPKESVWELVSHFFKDITHFDGKFFSTLRYLMTRPGFLSREYMLGRRASYVNPIRMYIFTSAFFFLIFFSVFNIDKESLNYGAKVNGKTFAQVERMDSLSFDEFTREVNKKAGKPALPMNRQTFRNFFDSSLQSGDLRFTGSSYASKEAYDSLRSAGKVKHNWIQRQFIYKEIEIKEKFKDRPGDALKAFGDILLHSLPQMVFLSLPLLALLLKLLYFRRKDYYYVDHGIFSLHFYIFIFMAMLTMFGLGKINSYLDWGFIRVVLVIMGFGLFFYLYKAMRKFYGQRRAKTITKFLLLCLLLYIVFILLFLAFVFFSVFKL